jgi:hypothetical protein
MADIDPNVLGTNIVIGKSRKNRKLSSPPSVGMVCCFASYSDYDFSECGGEYQVIMILVNVSSNILVFIMILVNVIVNFRILIMHLVNVIVKVRMIIIILMKGIVKNRMHVLF